MTERLNIRRMQVPEEKATLNFDVRKEVLDSDWQEMRKELEEEWAVRGRRFIGTVLASQMQVIAGNREFLVSESQWEKMEKDLVRSKKRESANDAFQCAAEMKIINPQYDPHLTPDDWTKAHAEAEALLTSTDTTPPDPIVLYAKFISFMKILDRSVSLPEEKWQILYAKLNELLETKLGHKREMAFFLASRMKLIDPGRAVSMPKEEWNFERGMLQKYRSEKKYTQFFLSRANDMAIMAAPRLDFDAPGFGIGRNRASEKISDSSRPQPDALQV
jgi:hypothetical protein